MFHTAEVYLDITEVLCRASVRFSILYSWGDGPP